MSDLISRQAAIEALDRFSLGETDAVKLAFRMGDYLKRLPSAEPEPSTFRVNHELTKEEYDKLMHDIKDAPIVLLPSAQQWIPCSERVPEDSGWYIVTKNLAYDTTWVGLEWYNHENGWKYDDGKCTAWMPLPEPYKGEQE